MKSIIKTVFVLLLLFVAVVGVFFLYASLNQKELEIASIQQQPELPQGCEITSLTMVLHYYGFTIDKTSLADEYLPKSTDDLHINPDIAYVGNPRGNGWYCNAYPIVDAANQYLQAQDSDLLAQDVTGLGEKEICQFINDGVPVIIWSTLNFEAPVYSDTVRWLVEGENVAPLTNLHVLVVYGYTYDSFKIIDPQGGHGSIARDTLMNSNAFVGNYAVVVASG